METRRAQEDDLDYKPIRRGWCLGGETFRKELLESVHARATESHHAATRRETTVEKAHRLLHEELDKLGWTESELAQHPKGDARKIRIAQRLRDEPTITLKWIAKELHMGTWAHVANRLHQTKVKSKPANQHELNLV